MAERICTARYEGEAEALEGSFVYLGCQYGAQVTGLAAEQGRNNVVHKMMEAKKQALAQQQTKQEASQMSDLTEKENGQAVAGAELQAEVDALKEKLAEKQAEIERLTALAEDGRAARAAAATAILEKATEIDAVAKHTDGNGPKVSETKELLGVIGGENATLSALEALHKSLSRQIAAGREAISITRAAEDSGADSEGSTKQNKTSRAVVGEARNLAL